MFGRALVGVTLLFATAAIAQHGEHRPESKPTPAKKDEKAPEPRRTKHATTGPLGIPLNRRGSGTGWLPDSTPMYGSMWMPGDWMIMLHGNLFAGGDFQSGPRGETRFAAPNWLMLMAQRPLGGGEFAARVMFSLEPFTIGGQGYPLLLQTGESDQGRPLRDAQHPHDLFMELALVYTRAVSESVGFQLYLAAAGEPALGPVAFPHRISAFSDPLAPLGHHWLDSTHIGFGVLTAGVFTRHLKVEASLFNGREPDERRYDIDLRRPNAFSARVSVSPTPSWSVQASYGYLDSPEGLYPDDSLHRITASVTYNRRLGERGNWATTAAWGHNHSSDEPMTDALLLESNLELDGHHLFFGRAEVNRKTGRDLALPIELEQQVFNMGMIAVGHVHSFGPFAGLVPGIGVRASFDFVGEGLERFYGGHVAYGLMLFIQLRPAEMQMNGRRP